MVTDTRALDILTSFKRLASPVLRRKAWEIAMLAERYRHLLSEFTFSADPELEEMTNRALVGLSDEIMDLIRTRLIHLIEELEATGHEEEVVQEAEKEDDGIPLVARIDRYSTDFKNYTEGWLEIGFALGLTSEEIVERIMTYIDAPLASKEWRDALFEAEFMSVSLKEEGQHPGRGRSRGILEGLAVIFSVVIMRARHFIDTAILYPLMGATGYMVHRGSDFDCQICDDYTGIVWPLHMRVLPIHPRCMCWTTPVTGNGKGEA